MNNRVISATQKALSKLPSPEGCGCAGRKRKMMAWLQEHRNDRAEFFAKLPADTTPARMKNSRPDVTIFEVGDDL